jgi:two-component system alkaline phosphatase synthesis response regulator PhoP
MPKLKQRILTIDDEPGVGILLKRVLEETGLYSVASESDAFRAVWRARAFRPDILLIDINMPGQTGIEIALQLRSEPWLRFRPIIFFTGLETRETPRALELGDGLTEFLAKGVSSETVIATVGRLLASCTGVAPRS